MNIKDKNEINSGDNSQNIQAGIVIYEGISEKRAREIAEEILARSLKEYHDESIEIATNRIKEFINILIPKISSIENALEIFKDPSFQLILQKAQVQAATTDKIHDYEILSELLVHRYNKKDNKISCTGIKGAIEIVDEISDEVLTALTVATSLSIGIHPIASNVSEGLNILNDLFSKILIVDFPTTLDWMDQLDILKAIRISSFGNLKKLEDFYFNCIDNYLLAGIDVKSENFDILKQILDKLKLNYNIMIDNELLKGYVKLPIESTKNFDNLKKVINGKLVKFTEEEQQELQKIIKLYNNDEKILIEMKQKFIEKFDSYESLRKVRAWWNSLSKSFEITAIGKTLGHANAQHCYPDFPQLD